MICKDILPKNKNFKGLQYKNYCIYNSDMNKILANHEDCGNLKKIFIKNAGPEPELMTVNTA